jgi:hypothetical protein
MLLVLFDGHARDTKACAIDGGTEGQSSPARPSAASEDEAPLMANVAALAEAIWPKHLLPDRPQDVQQHSRRKFELRLRGPHEHAGHFVSDHWSGMQTHFSTPWSQTVVPRPFASSHWRCPKICIFEMIFDKLKSTFPYGQRVLIGNNLKCFPMQFI